jgi:hypothetical protein
MAPPSSQASAPARATGFFRGPCRLLQARAQGDHQPRRAGALTMPSSNALFSNCHKVPAWRVPSEALNTPKMGATAGVALPVACGSPPRGLFHRLLADPVDHGWAGGRDDAAITPTLGPGRRQAWACAQSIGVVAWGRILCRLGSNLGGPVRVGGSARLQYCNQRHAASGSGFGCPSRAGPGGSPGTKIQSAAVSSMCARIGP